ncbi:c-type cytochrome [Effusibacillus lacus]|uniref:Cytochrome c domain-containing protein n=1 Tax=Effusibacillus lacus TaxID=1348429 RepID=A0A292YGI2_9BACL|nr:cytochrome c [Effusibacillus lacus]TCS74585.1 cbb3-type cytochrome c oxidase subunit III [Effusibacillus lacus]GAX88458.1 hypothetical protein EFBL_0067 [Effusibacillus lacus]
MKNFLIYVGGGVLFLLLFFVTAFTTVDAGLPENHGAPFWGNSEIEKKGHVLFQTAGCYSCHSYRGQQGQVTGPTFDSVGLRLNEQAIEMFIRKGTAIMPAYEGKLKDEEIKTLAKWLSEMKVQEKR